nr:MAG TPA: hypothetical protein [Caudoviricetes sp.]
MHSISIEIPLDFISYSNLYLSNFIPPILM